MEKNSNFNELATRSFQVGKTEKALNQLKKMEKGKDISLIGRIIDHTMKEHQYDNFLDAAELLGKNNKLTAEEKKFAESFLPIYRDKGDYPTVLRVSKLLKKKFSVSADDLNKLALKIVDKKDFSNAYRKIIDSLSPEQKELVLKIVLSKSKNNNFNLEAVMRLSFGKERQIHLQKFRTSYVKAGNLVKSKETARCLNSKLTIEEFEKITKINMSKGKFKIAESAILEIPNRKNGTARLLTELKKRKKNYLLKTSTYY